MYVLTTEKSFDSAHFLKGYNGKCSNIHGHRWRVVAQLKGNTLMQDSQSGGMVVDFSVFKNALAEITESFDHKFLIEKNSLKDSTLTALIDEGFEIIELGFRPTAENLAKMFFELMKEKGFNMKSVSVYETPNNCACYEE